MRWRDLALPVVVAVAVLGLAAYFWFQGRSKAVPFVVTDSSVAFVSAADRRVPEPLREDLPSERLMLLTVGWAAAEKISGGDYYVLVTVPSGWTGYACVPDCKWGTNDDVQRFAKALPRTPYPEGAIFPADEAGQVTVTFVPPEGDEGYRGQFQPAAWLVQTDGGNVLGTQRIS
ncbi:MAG: hypothetical protein GEU96_14835 [Propionibacteriales bacterium]|nr:hypothetical protein [Propionibacteriales bacterium]